MPGPRILNDRYRINELIGRGGMADVFRGRDLRLNRTVAVKLMRADLARDAQFQARFRREARAAAALNHPSIVGVYDTGDVCMSEDEHHPVDCPFLVLEHVSGRTLREVLDDGCVPWRRAAAWTVGVLEALEHSHEEGIVHRDVKPANVMVTPAGDVKVTDFGLARALADTSANTSQQTVVGTALYLSPEQATGRAVDARADLYSAGCVLFELLTGRPPFTGDTPLAVAYQHVRETPPAPSEVASGLPPALDPVVLRALRKDPAERYASATEFRRALEAAVADPTALPLAEEGPVTRALPAAPPAVGEGGRPDDAPDDADTQAVAGHAVAGTSLPGAPSAAQLAAAASVDGRSPSTGSHHAVAPARPTTGPLALVPAAPTPAGSHAAPPPPEPGTSRRRLLALVGAMGAVLLLLAAVLSLTLGGRGLGPSTVPDLRGRTEAEAVAALSDAGLTAAVVPVFHASVPAQHVVDTDPAAGAAVDRGDEVRVHVSRGPADVVVPESLQGAPESTVRAELERLGLSVSSVEYQDAGGMARGRLVRTDPTLGSGVDSGTPVVLYLSSGMVPVPDLVGMTVEDAQATLRRTAPDLATRVQSDEGGAVDTGVVVGQDPPAGTRVDNRSAITLTTSSSAIATVEGPALVEDPAAPAPSWIEPEPTRDPPPAEPPATAPRPDPTTAAPAPPSEPRPSSDDPEPSTSVEPTPDPSTEPPSDPVPGPDPSEPSPSGPAPDPEPDPTAPADPDPSTSGGVEPVVPEPSIEPTPST